MGGLLPSSSSRSTSWESSSSSKSSGMNGHSELSVALIFPVSNSINISEVSFLPTKYLVSCSCADVNGDISTNSDMENGNRCKGLEGVGMTYISPDCGSIMYVSCGASSSVSGICSRCCVRTSGASDEGAETLVVVAKDDMDQREAPDVLLRA